MAIMGYSPAADMSLLRTQQTLAMQAQAPAAGAAPAAAADPAAAAAASTAGAAAGAPSGPTADAAVGAAAVQEPPSTSKIVLQSVLRGAMTGASVTLGLKSLGPILGKVGFIKNFMGTMPVVGPPPIPGTGLLGKLGSLPIVGGVLGKMLGGGLAGFAITALVGAGVGALFGAFSGLKKAKAAAAEYAEAMAAQQAAAAQQPPVGDPVNAPAPAPEGAPAPVGKRAKSWIISRSGSTSKTGGSFGTYTARKGDTIATLAERFHTTPAEIKKLNPGISDSVEPGTKLKLKRKVVPDAKAWVA